MIKNYIFILSICLFFIASPLMARTPDGISIGQLQVLEDSSTALSFDQILTQKHFFQDVHEKTPNYQFSSSAFWFRLPAQNQTNRDKSLFLNLQSPTMDKATLHIIGSGNRHDIVHSGDRIPAKNRPVPQATTLVLPFTIPSGESVDLYIRVQADAGVIVCPFQIMDGDELADYLFSIRTLHGIILGIFIALVIHNLLLYLMLKEQSRLYYLLYLPFCLLGFTSINGFGPTFFYPENTWLGNEGMLVFFGASLFFSLLFSRVFLRTHKIKFYDHLIKIAAILSLLMAVSPFLIPLNMAYRISAVLLFGIPLLLMVTSAILLLRGFTEARFYMLSNAMVCICLLVLGLALYDWIPFHYLVLDSISIGVSAGALLHSLALADHIRILQNKVLVAEDKARRHLELRKGELETLVAERTRELEDARKHAEHQAETDSLTGIMNRRGMLGAGSRLIYSTLRYGRPLSIAIFDLDHFKIINDRYGHMEGDRVLRDIARTVAREVRVADLFGRIGGEEFLVIMPDTTMEAAVELAERLRQSIASNIFVGKPPQAVTASFGVAGWSEELTNAEILVKAADDALYRAKQNGRNRVEINIPPG